MAKRLHAVLPAAPETAGIARQLARERITDWRLTTLADDVVQVVSELVANAISAAQANGSGQVALWLACRPGTVFVAVANRTCLAARIAEPGRLPASDLAERGRGLAIAAALSRRIRWHGSADWTIVSAEFGTPTQAKGTGHPTGGCRTAAYEPLPESWHFGRVMTLAGKLFGAHLALGGGGLGSLLVHLIIWHAIWRGIYFVWGIPRFGPYLVVVIIAAVIGSAIWRRRRGSWRPGRRSGAGSTGYGTGAGPRDW